MEAAFQALEQLLFVGFLSKTILLGGVSLTLKTRTPKEDQQLADLLRAYEEKSIARFLVLAFHILKVDGRYVLEERQSDWSSLSDFLQELPLPMLERVEQEVLALVRRAQDASTYIVPYVFTDVSRDKWSCYQNHQLCDPLITGVPGTQYLGLNPSQEYWVSYNRQEDLRLANDKNYSMFQYLACFLNDKSGRKMMAHEETRKKNLDRYRAYYLQGYSPDGFDADDPDNAENMNRYLEQRLGQGILDEHDQFIEDYLTEIVEEFDAHVSQFDNQEVEFDGHLVMDEAELLEYMRQIREGSVSGETTDRVWSYDREGQPIYTSEYSGMVDRLRKTSRL